MGRSVCPVRVLFALALAALTGPLGGSRLLGAEALYFNDFNGKPGTTYVEWTSSPITWRDAGDAKRSGTLPAPVVTNCESPNRKQRFLGEFGGPAVAARGEPGYMRTRVEQTVTLTLTNLPPHRALMVTFDLYVLKSWDGNSPAYGPDRWRLDVAGGLVLLDTTFSNNPKTKTEGSFQDYPRPGSAPWTGAVATNSLGYSAFFADGKYQLDFTFPHVDRTLRLNFTSSLFEGKGTADESWGLDNVKVILAPESAADRARP